METMIINEIIKSIFLITDSILCTLLLFNKDNKTLIENKSKTITFLELCKEQDKIINESKGSLNENDEFLIDEIKDCVDGVFRELTIKDIDNTVLLKPLTDENNIPLCNKCIKKDSGFKGTCCHLKTYKMEKEKDCYSFIIKTNSLVEKPTCDLTNEEYKMLQDSKSSLMDKCFAKDTILSYAKEFKFKIDLLKKKF